MQWHVCHRTLLQINNLILSTGGCTSVDFVLRDPREKDEDKKEVLPPHREELEVVPKPWKKTYHQCREIAIDQLHITNPCMLQVLQLWHNSFG